MESKTFAADDKNDARRTNVAQRFQAVDSTYPIPSSEPLDHSTNANMQTPLDTWNERNDERRETAIPSDDPPPAYRFSYIPPTSTNTERTFEPVLQPVYDEPSPGFIRCALVPNQTAVWHAKRIAIGPLAGALLIREKFIDAKDLELLHAPEAEADLEPIEPLSGIAYATARTITGIIGGVADYPIEITKAIRSRDKPTSRSSSPHPASPNPLLASHQPPTQAREPTSPLSQAADFTKHKGVARIIGTGLRAPMDFTYNLARGFHNAPKLYGDETVRESPKITDIKSGLKASGSEFGYGLYDGITGIFTQPVKGAQKNGAVGFLEGFVMGIGGAVCKPSAAVCAIPGYTFNGIYKEIRKPRGPEKEQAVADEYMEQGRAELKASSKETRNEAVSRWLVVREQMGRS